MSVDKFIIKDGATIKETIDLNDRIYSGLSVGDHTITVEAYLGNTFVSSDSQVVNIPNTFTYDVDYQAKLDRAVELNIPLPTTAQSAIYNQRVIDLKPTTAWTNSTVICDYSGDADIQFKLICIKRRVLTVAYGGGTWSVDGWKGNGVNAYIDPLYNTGDGGNWSRDNAAVSWLSFHKGVAGVITGTINGDNNVYSLIWPNNGGSSYSNLNGFQPAVPAYGILGFNSVSRIVESDVSVNGINDGNLSRGFTPLKMLIGVRHFVDPASSDDTFTDEGISFIMMGGAITDYAAVKTILEP